MDLLRCIVVLITAVGGAIFILAAHAPMARADECGPGEYPSSAHQTCVESPDSSNSGATAICGDGSDSHSLSHSGTCSHHGGVQQWCPCGAAPNSASVGPSATATDPDSVYMNYTNAHGTPLLIDTPDIRQAMHSFGMTKICNPLDGGATAAQVAQPLLDQGDTRSAAQTDMTGAVVAYCPSYLAAVNAYWQRG